MAQSWYSVIDKELDSVDVVMRKEVRSAYPELNDMCEATLSSQYHKVRPALCILTYYANGGKDSDVAVSMASCYESVFDGLHLHDRIDGDGKVIGEKKKLFSKTPSTTKVIVAGDFMYMMGFRLAYGRVPAIVPYLMKATSSISDAIFKLVNHMGDVEVTEEDCLDILVRKGAIEFQIVMESAAKLAEGDEEAVTRMSQCGKLLGMAIQLSYDIHDITGSPDGKKPSMVTLTTGFPTLPLYYAMKDPKIGERIKSLFSNKEPSDKDAIAASLMIKETDVVPRCKALIADYSSRAREILALLPDSEYKTALVKFSENLTL
jgi:octaprenyl-diphosphate synthase